MKVILLLYLKEREKTFGFWHSKEKSRNTFISTITKAKERDPTLSSSLIPWPWHAFDLSTTLPVEAILPTLWIQRDVRIGALTRKVCFLLQNYESALCALLHALGNQTRSKNNIKITKDITKKRIFVDSIIWIPPFYFCAWYCA